MDLVKCPTKGCEERVHEETLVQLLKDDILQRFKKLKLNQEVAKDPNKVFCPNPGCENVVKGTKKKPKTLC